MAELTSCYKTCLECEKNFEIFNDDIDFSLTLHKQSHKTLEDANKEFDENQLNQEYYLNSSSKYCIDCRKDMEIVSNDKSFSLQLRGQKHKSNTSESSSHKPISGLKEKAIQSVFTDEVDVLFNTLVGNNSSINLNATFLERKGNIFICKLCAEIAVEKIDLKRLETDLIQHIKGAKHLKNYSQGRRKIKVIAQNIVERRKQQLSSTTNFNYNLNVDCLNDVFEKLLNTNETIKVHSHYLMVKNRKVLCILCKGIRISSKPEKLEYSIMCHVTGKGHNNRVAFNEFKAFNKMLDEAQIFNMVIKTNRKFLLKVDGFLLCTLCEWKIPFMHNTDILVKNITSHFEGTEHVSKSIEKGSKLMVISQPPESVKTGLEPQPNSLTSCTVNDLDCLIAIFENLLETNEAIKLNAPYLKQQNNDIVCIVCQVECFGGHSAIDTSTVEQCLMSHVTRKKHIKNVGSVPEDLVKKSFDTLPMKYMKDKEFLTLSPTKGCLKCRLCNCTIPPRFLKDHLDDKLHIQRKEEFKASVQTSI